MTLAERMAKWTSVGSGCWEWTGCKDRQGYGRINIGQVPQLAHRVAWELVNGAVPAGLDVDHLCRNRACVNPAHLEPVTHSENMRRSRKPVCRRGLHLKPLNQRECMECRRERKRIYDAARRAGRKAA